MAHKKWDPDAMRWIPHEQPFSRPKPRQVNRHMLLRGLAEEVVYEDSVAQMYTKLLAAVSAMAIRRPSANTNTCWTGVAESKKLASEPAMS
jgi:hypothetical protein